MRILFVNQFFLPDEAATSSLLGDLTAAIDGDVEVLCGRSQYVGGQESPAPHVGVRRLPAPSFGHGRLQKLQSYAAFFIGAFASVLFGRKPDVIVTMTTPPLLGLIGLAAQVLRGSRHYIWEMDVYPDIATELGVFPPGGWVDRIVGWLADGPRRRADGVIALGPCMADRLCRRGTPPERIHICHNWSDGDAMQPRPFQPDGALKILYAGNFGLAHDFDTIAEALSVIGQERGFAFLFSGGGPQWGRLRDLCRERGYVNCQFQPFQPRESLNGLLGNCDIGLVTQKAGTEGAVVPSKVYGLMAAGRATLYVGPAQATPARIMVEHQTGWRIANGAASELVSRLRLLRAQPHLYQEAGHRARVAFDQEYDVRIGVRRVLIALGLPKVSDAGSRKWDRGGLGAPMPQYAKSNPWKSG